MGGIKAHLWIILYHEQQAALNRLSDVQVAGNASFLSLLEKQESWEDQDAAATSPAPHHHTRWILSDMGGIKASFPSSTSNCHLACLVDRPVMIFNLFTQHNLFYS